MIRELTNHFQICKPNQLPTQPDQNQSDLALLVTVVYNWFHWIVN